MPNARLTMGVKNKLDCLINSLYKQYDTKNHEKIESALANVLKACSNTCLESGVPIKGKLNKLTMSSLWEIKHACEYVEKNLPEANTCEMYGFNSKIKSELNFLLKGVENRIKIEWEILNEGTRNNSTLRDGLMERLRDPIDGHVLGLTKNGALESNI
ncbi:hypothetical protein [Chromobacterium amazonense]|uniref:Uncharacterized protein n=1 Tax=Chromobacterium amazonense TaxID=1382803 RepID=A0ABU8UZM5_9NEIS|nr:hypothetical protein [Chromobacterium amazonense]MDQ4539733.1 hypothetical protein [Chromobacterium amazonense]